MPRTTIGSARQLVMLTFWKLGRCGSVPACVQSQMGVQPAISLVLRRYHRRTDEQRHKHGRTLPGTHQTAGDVTKKYGRYDSPPPSHSPQRYNSIHNVGATDGVRTHTSNGVPNPGLTGVPAACTSHPHCCRPEIRRNAGYARPGTAASAARTSRLHHRRRWCQRARVQPAPRR